LTPSSPYWSAGHAGDSGKGFGGASGDLAPLAHLALALIGEGEAFFQGERLPSAEALGRAGLAPVQLEVKEGLALLNGTQAMAAVGALSCTGRRELLAWPMWRER